MQQHHSETAMKPVRIYTTSMCPYCYRAKALLTQKGVDFEEIDISFTPGARSEMLARSGGRTSVPQVFVGDTHVGGSDDLAALDRNGGLDDLLAA